MRVGVLGAGTVAQAFARLAIAADHEVLLSNSRDPSSLRSVIAALGPRVSAVSPAEAMREPVVLLALPWPAVERTLSALCGWNRQILIDATNAFNDGTPDSGIVDFGGSSSSERVAALAPGARVVKAMNSVVMSDFSSGTVDGLRQVAFVSGDDPSARTIVADLFESFGFAPIDLGDLAMGGRMQAVGGPIARHNFHVPWPAPRAFPAFNGQGTVE